MVAAQLTIDGQAQPLARLRFSMMSLSSARMALTTHSFRIAVDQQPLLQLLQIPYQHWVQASPGLSSRNLLSSPDAEYTIGGASHGRWLTISSTDND